jgi:hypothetical protein
MVWDFGGDVMVAAAQVLHERVAGGGTEPGSSFAERITSNTETVLVLPGGRASGAAGRAGRPDSRAVRDGAEPP